MLYMFSVLAPSVALAASNPSETPHCLMEPAIEAHSHTHGGAEAKGHVPVEIQHHKDGKDGGSDGGDKSHPRCCGLFCVTALAEEQSVDLVTPLQFSFGRPGLAGGFTDRSPERIIRPPIV